MDFLQRGRTHAEFEQFVAGHVDRLLGAGILMTGDPVEAEDLVQECLLRVARRWPRVRRMDHPGAYARRILVNLALRGAASRNRRTAEIDAAGPGSPMEAAPALDSKLALIDALRLLPRQQRAIIVLRYFEDLSVAEVADLLGCSVGTVKSTASRGLVRLREVLEAPVADDHAGGEESASQREGALPRDREI